MASYKDLGIPVSDSTVEVKLFNNAPASMSFVRAENFLQPVLPGRERLSATAFFSFLIDHPILKRRIMFDLGPRKDIENLVPALAEAFTADPLTNLPLEKDTVDLLVAGNITLESINTVVWSHAHFDHIGDMSKFPSSTELVIGQGTDMSTYPQNPNSMLQESDCRGRKVTELNFDESLISIGGLKAIDYFEDGSLYILSAPGHIAGHVVALARVTPTTFLLLGGDSCHHVGQLRPSDQLHRNYPCPGELLAASRKSITPSYFSNEESVIFDLAARRQPFLDVPEGKFYQDPIAARVSIRKIGHFDANPDVFVVLAHDETLVGLMEEFPASLNDWKSKGWKQRVIWAFIDETNSAFRFSPA